MAQRAASLGAAPLAKLVGVPELLRQIMWSHIVLSGEEHFLRVLTETCARYEAPAEIVPPLPLSDLQRVVPAVEEEFPSPSCHWSDSEEGAGGATGSGTQ